MVTAGDFKNGITLEYDGNIWRKKNQKVIRNKKNDKNENKKKNGKDGGGDDCCCHCVDWMLADG